MKIAKAMVACAVLGASIAACQGVDPERANAVFADCLRRNGVVAEDLAVTMSGDSIESISLQIVSEGEIPYEPTVRLACSEEVENL